MKHIFLLIAISFFTTTLFAQQQMTLKDWSDDAESDIRMLPKYGYKEKTQAQKDYDQRFINETMQQSKFKGDRTAASNDLVKLGFNYMYEGDLKRAMYRFNQAYLLDSLNSEIYLGYGAIFLALRDFKNAENQYKEGLAINSKNSHLLTDYGTFYLGKYYDSKMQEGQKEDLLSLDEAITWLSKSYEINSKDQNTSFKLSIVYWNKGDCTNAWKYYDICKSLGGQPITPEYTNDLKKKCPR